MISDTISSKIEFKRVLEYVPSYLQVADILTKPLTKGKLEMLRKRLGLVDNTFLAKREC
jgi:hypothetical protein